MRNLQATSILFLLFWGASILTAHSQSSGSVIDYSDVYTLEHSDLGTVPPVNLNIRQYSLSNTRGGGEFVLRTSGCTSDDGVFLNDTHNPTPNCYVRQFAGPVHLSWYGITDAAESTCYASETAFAGCKVDSHLDAAFSAATPSAKLGGDGGVVTDGMSIVVYGHDLMIPSQQYFSCSGPPGASRKQPPPLTGSIPYYTLQNSIVLGFGHTIKRSPNSLLENCIVRPTWYNAAQLKLVTDTPDTRSLIDNIEHLFTGTATLCGFGSSTGEACDMHDMFIFGFDICDDSSNSPRAIIRNINMECNVDEFIHDNGGGMKLENLHSHSFIEQSMDFKNTVWPISGIANVGGEVQLSFAVTGSNHPIPGDTILATGIGTDTAEQQAAPQGQNARWMVESIGSCSSTCTILLKGSSWAGPTYTGSKWNSGSNAIKVYDTTNIGGGQYICSPGTAPFCTAPNGFTAPNVTSDTAITGTSDLPLLALHSTGTPTPALNWPQKGLIQVGSEIIGYTLVDRFDIQVTFRGADGSTSSPHAAGFAATPSAPMVIAPVPSANAVIVNATASLPNLVSTGDSVQFANDTALHPDPSGNYGSVVLNAAYRTWTGNTAAGSTPDGKLTVNASVTSGNPQVTLLSPYAFKAQEGMSVTDTAGVIPAGTYVAQTPTDSTHVQISGSPTGTAATDQLQFSGCGYPGLKDTSVNPALPYLGNCAATAYLLYGVADQPAAGTTCDWIDAHGWRVYFHMNYGHETVCNKIVFDSGSNGIVNVQVDDTADPTSYGIWIEGSGDKTELTDGKMEARTGFLDTGTGNDGASLSDFNFATGNDYSVVFAAGNTARAVLANLHGGSSGIGYADSSESSLTLTGSDLQKVSVYFDDPSKFSQQVSCANDTFATPVCSNSLTHIIAGGTIPTISGTATTSTSSIAGNDSVGRIAIGSSLPTGKSLKITFGTAWAAKPVCFAQDETTKASNPVIVTSISVNAVTFQLAATPLAADNVSYHCIGFS